MHESDNISHESDINLLKKEKPRSMEEAGKMYEINYHLFDCLQTAAQLNFASVRMAEGARQAVRQGDGKAVL